MQLVLSSEIAPRPSEIAPRSASSQQGPGAARRGAADGVGAQGTTYGAFDLAYDPIAGHWAGGSPTQEAGYEKGRHASGDDGGDGGAGGGGDGGGGLLGAAARCADLYATTPARLGTCRGHTGDQGLLTRGEGLRTQRVRPYTVRPCTRRVGGRVG